MFFFITCFYAWWDQNNEWTAVFWASYKNLTIIGCLYFLYERHKIIYSDKIFIGGAIIVNSIQSFMYLLCPFSTDGQKVWFFSKFAWFVLLVSVVCIILYLKELWKRH